MSCWYAVIHKVHVDLKYDTVHLPQKHISKLKNLFVLQNFLNCDFIVLICRNHGTVPSSSH